jgi:hypothetical protein
MRRVGYQIATVPLGTLIVTTPAIAAQPSPYADHVGEYGFIDGGDWACPSPSAMLPNISGCCTRTILLRP